ncbi:UbiH/UbiF/VisC/COQ6 family ubiquinone biosynthesis hydroxylase [Kineobactrum salinum]|uniref:UbiH/UbiF/VisC/COQ6 family ubiquinone biosynthesis hydroxylase n=1 Tax=Kineobactrum salinum TaxID=2708301 RepID=A0A6C0U056_9GAMM|nr:UbiH/UbiF/VisC/COQ6 family ubiquinone biosynthesis hydroxylase [Kineobactrum salinum]QIB65480.1 UbiH/UbiF/VisC/COQ6 family ubiquinone biosynthesis hydroxylase [Kineobactrum salinum]
MAETQRYDVVIVGGGIAGSALALALSGQGLSLAVVEARALAEETLPEDIGLPHFDPRVVALNPQSQALLQGWGAWSGVAGYRHCAYRHMTVWDADGTGRIDFDCRELATGALGHIVENRALLQSLLRPLQRCADVRLLAPERLHSCERVASGTQVTLDSGLVLEASLLVAADGGESRVRQLMGFRTREWDYGQHAIVATVRLEHDHAATAWQRFLPTGPLAFLPLPGAQGHYCSIVWSLQSDGLGPLMELPDAAFCEALGAAFEHRLGAVTGCSRRFAFALRQRHAVDYVQTGVALIADAAHTIHPLAGQGINLGLQDVAVLAQEVIRAGQRGMSPGRIEVLQRYQRRRKSDNLLMMAAMEGFKRLFEQRALSVRWLRNAGMRGVERAAPVKRMLMQRAMGLAD